MAVNHVYSLGYEFYMGARKDKKKKRSRSKVVQWEFGAVVAVGTRLEDTDRTDYSCTFI